MAQMTRAEIRLAQQAINRMNLRGADGRRIALRVDGIVGPKTMAAMTMAAQQPQSAAVPLPRPKPAPAPPGLGALMGMPAQATAGAPSFMRPPTAAPPMPSYDVATAGPSGRPPSRYGGMPMRDPESRFRDLSLPVNNRQEAAEANTAAAVKYAPIAARLVTPPPLREFTSPLPPPLGGMGMAGNMAMGLRPASEASLEPSGVIPGLPTPETRLGAMEGAGVVPGAPRPMPSPDRWADATAPAPAPPAPPGMPFPLSLIHDLGIDTLTDTASRVFGGPTSATAQPEAGGQSRAGGQGGLPRGVRNNNPGNIEFGGFTKGHGATSSDGRFAKFSSPEQGIAAIIDLQRQYEDNYGLKTVAQRINRWAPAGGGDGNNPSAYAASVARAMGISPTQPFSIRDPAMAQRFVAAMIQVENGRQPYTPQQIASGYAASKTAGGNPMAYADTASLAPAQRAAAAVAAGMEPSRNTGPAFPTNYQTAAVRPAGLRRVPSTTTPPLNLSDIHFLPYRSGTETEAVPLVAPPPPGGAKAAPVKSLPMPPLPGPPNLLDYSRNAAMTAPPLTLPQMPPPAGGSAAMFNPTPITQQVRSFGQLGANPPAFASREMTPAAQLPSLPTPVFSPPPRSAQPVEYSPPGVVPPPPRANPSPNSQTGLASLLQALMKQWPGRWQGPGPVTGPFSITNDYTPASMFMYGTRNVGR